MNSKHSYKKFFVAGIGTNVGKTIVSAIIVESLKADYWKPIQSGSIEGTDTNTIKKLVSNNKTTIHPETYVFKDPISPHQAALNEKKSINFNKIIPPQISNHLIIESAGGLMVPLNSKFLMIDLIKKISPKVILVSQNYLGSINHTILSIKILQKFKIEILGVIINGEENKSSEKIIKKFGEIDIIARVPKLLSLNKNTIKIEAERLERRLCKLIH